MTRPLNTEYIPASGWRPDLRFWTTHLFLPLAALAVLAILLETTGFELWLADRWYAAEGGYWALRHHWLTYDVMHHYGKLMVITTGVALLALIVPSGRYRSRSEARAWEISAVAGVVLVVYCFYKVAVSSLF